MKKITIALFILTVLLGACAPVSNAPTTGQTRYGLGVELFVDVPAPTNSTPAPAPTLVPYIPEQTSGGEWWNCADQSGEVSDGFFHPRPGKDAMRICVDPKSQAVNISTLNARVTGATVVEGTYVDPYFHLTVKLASNQDGCVKTSAGCKYTITPPNGWTFGQLAEVEGQNLYPLAPELQKQGVVVWIRLMFQPGIHSVRH